jgi:hypothetical protein
MAGPGPYDPPYVDDKVDTLEFTSMRIHELALQRWLNKAFLVQDGYPVPVIFSVPRDAHAEFGRLWKMEGNPFSYLLNMTDSQGRKVYQPYPTNVIYPLICVKRLNWRLRPSQSAGYHMNRRVYYPTVNGNGTIHPIYGSGSVTRDDLAWTGSLGLETGWDFRFQIDHFCNTPQTQAIFVNQLQRKLRFTGAQAQTFIVAKFPFPHQKRYLRMYLESDIDNVSNEAVNEQSQEIRTSFTICIEGYWMDYLTQFNPVMWEYALGKEKTTVPPDMLDRYFDFNDIYAGVKDVRIGETNPVVNSRPGLPLPPTT